MISRSRLFIILGVVGCALVILLRDSIAGLVVMAVTLAIMVVGTFTNLSRLADVHRHPAAFTVTQGRFAGTQAQSLGEPAMLMLVLLGGLIGSMLSNFEDYDPTVSGVLAWTQLGFVIVLGSFIIVFALLAWRVAANPVELTPEGVVSRVLWDSRTVPWEALAPGGPPRPRPFEARIRLWVIRPELVRRSRFRLPGVGNSVLTLTGVHPWLVADAIRWYAEHPEDRAAIGTEAEHARLLTTLGADSLAQSAPPAPEPPGVVKAAIRLGYTGVAFGLLTAIVDVALIFGLADRFQAHAVAVGEQEIRDYGGEPVDWASSVYFTQAWYVLILVIMGILSLVALMSVRKLKLGSPVGRIGLIVISSVAAVWALMPCFDLAFDAPPGLTPLLIAVAFLKRLGYLGLGVTTLVLLVMPTASAFTGPRPPSARAEVG